MELEVIEEIRRTLRRVLHDITLALREALDSIAELLESGVSRDVYENVARKFKEHVEPILRKLGITLDDIRFAWSKEEDKATYLVLELKDGRRIKIRHARADVLSDCINKLKELEKPSFWERWILNYCDDVYSDVANIVKKYSGKLARLGKMYIRKILESV